MAQVLIHPSQFPGQVRRDLMDSLRSRALNHKFLYDGIKQTRKWLALHQACSPSRTDPECAAVYDRAFMTAAAQLGARDVHLLGLGCGGGQKDTRALQLLLPSGNRVSYAPVDVSTAMVLTARENALARVPGLACTPLVCDLATASDLPGALAPLAPPGARRLITCFGLIPNFEQTFLPRLAALLGPDDRLLLSANLAPGPAYAEGMKRILPLYDNPPTRDWLLSFLLDLGVETADGEILFTVEDGGAGLKRVVARFEFRYSAPGRGRRGQGPVPFGGFFAPVLLVSPHSSADAGIAG